MQNIFKRPLGLCAVRDACGAVDFVAAFAAFFPPVCMVASARPKETAATKAANKPVKSFRLSGLTVSIFANKFKREDKPAVLFHKTSIQKTYRDSDGEFKTTTSFETDDLPVICFLLMKSFDFISTQKLDSSQEETD